MTTTSTLAHTPLATAHSPLRTSGYTTPGHGSRSSTPVRIKPIHALTAEHADRLSADSTPEGRVRRSASATAIRPRARAAAPHASASPNALHTAPSSPHTTTTVRRRRLSVTTYGDPNDDPPGAPGTATADLITFQPQPLLDALTPSSQAHQREAHTREAYPQPPLQACVLELQLPLTEYLVLGPEVSVRHAASLVAAEPLVRCVAVVTPNATHVLGREDVERLARYSHDPQLDTLGSFLAGSHPAPALRASAGLGAAAGLLLRRGGEFLAVLADEGGGFLGLVNREDLARALLADGGGRDAYEAQQLSSRLAAQGAAERGAAAWSGPSCSGRAEDVWRPGGLECGAAALAAASVAAAAAAVPASAAACAPPMPRPSLALPDSPPQSCQAPPHDLPDLTGGSRQLEASLGGWQAPEGPGPQQEGAQPVGPSMHVAYQDDGTGASPESSQWQAQDHGRQQPQAEQPRHGQHEAASASPFGSADIAGPAESLQSTSDPARSAWDLVDNVDDALDVLGLVGQSLNAEAVGRRLLGEAANLAGGSSGAGWLFKYLYDGDCSICRTLQAVIEKMDNGVGRVIFVDISAGGFNPLEHGGINYRAAMETVHILSANGEVFKGVTAVIKLLAAVDADIAASMGSLTTVLPVLSLAYMLVSRNRHALSGVWSRVLRVTGIDKALFGRDILEPRGAGTGEVEGGGAEGAQGGDKLQPQPSM